MADKVFRTQGQALVEVAAGRDASKRYKCTTHPTTGEHCYIELSAAENAQRDADEAAAALERAKPPQPTIEDRLAALEAKVKP